MDSEPFSWQFPPPSSSYRALNEELTLNEQRHFGEARQFIADRTNRRDNSTALPDSTERTATGLSSGDEMHNTARDYMHRSSAFSLQRSNSDDPLSEQSFLEWYPEGNATLTFQNDQNKLESIHRLNIDIINERSVVLAMAFEESRSGPRLFLDTLTSATAFPFLRFLYSGTYARNNPGGELFEDVPTSVLFHCQLYHLGEVYDLNDLKTQAYVNVIRQCEFGCSSPDKPIDLCAAIRYVYRHLSKHEKLINTIVDYCVSCFLRHRLGQDGDFKKLAYELRPFHQALCNNSMDRGFENEAAAAIIQLPFKPHIPETYASKEDILSNRFDDVFHFHDDIDSSPKKRKRPESSCAIATQQTQLPLRLHRDAVKKEVIDEEGGYKSVSKRRASSAAGSSAPLPVAVTIANSSLCHPSSSSIASEEVDSEEELPKVLRSETLEGAEHFLASDTEFEIIQGPSAVEELSDSDSDSSGIVEVKHEDAEPLRCRYAQSTSLSTDTHLHEGDSDSEWQLL